MFAVVLALEFGLTLGNGCPVGIVTSCEGTKEGSIELTI
jgi:hypothetical protein